jgi:hypothetical protein
MNWAMAKVASKAVPPVETLRTAPSAISDEGSFAPSVLGTSAPPALAICVGYLIELELRSDSIQSLRRQTLESPRNDSHVRVAEPLIGQRLPLSSERREDGTTFRIGLFKNETDVLQGQCHHGRMAGPFEERTQDQLA